MDFISLAQTIYSHHGWISRTRTLSEDDDFEHLDTTHSSHQEIAAAGDINGSIIEAQISKEIETILNEDLQNAPMLSQAAEAELFFIATNFLLYVAMVLIITMICKIYFPGALERTNPDSLPETRTYNYRRVENERRGRSSSYYSSDEEDIEQKEEQSLLKDFDIGLDGNSQTPSKNLGMTKDNTSKVLQKRSTLEFDQSVSSKKDVIGRLMFCVVMLNVTFVTWGALQERMLTRRYPRFTGEFFTYSYLLVFTTRVWTLVMSGFLMAYFKPRRSSSTIIYEYSLPSISNMLSSWCQYEALRYVSFPAVTLFKSFKLAPVMAMGKMLGNKQYPQYDYYVALCIGVGIAMFMSSTDDLKLGYNIYDQKASATWTGMMLLGFFLFFDSFTSQWQSRMFQRHRDLSMIELMFATSAFSSLLSLITLIHSNELGSAIDFVLRHSEIHLHFFLFSICATLGQLLIFYTIKNFGAVVFTIIMTTRVMLSISLSVYMYGHHVTTTGFFGLCLVVIAVGYRVKRKAEGNQLIKWRGIDNSKGPELVHEWHQHIDM